MVDYTEKAREYFSGDIYATETTGINIEKADVDYAKCTLDIEGKHLNANDQVMGGAMFTLADFTFAVAANTGKPLTVSVSAQIQYLSGAKGKKLTAETRCLKSGKRTCVMDISITDDLGTAVAQVTVTGMRKS